MSFSVLMDIPQLPIWKGTKTNLSQVRTAPFRFGLDTRGFIRQELDDNHFSVEAYSDDEYAFITLPPGHSDWANRFAKQYLDFITGALKDLKNTNILDIGGGSLYIANELTSATWGAASALVVDPAIREESLNSRVKIVRDYFPNTHSQGDYDVIISLNCLEHVPDPALFLSNMRLAGLKNNADILLVFPDVEQQLNIGDWNALLHEHISCFTKNSAMALFESVGLNVVSWKSEFDCHFFHLKPCPTTSANKSHNADLQIYSVRLKQSLDFVKNELTQLTQNNKKIGFHGATNGLNNLLYLSGFANHPNIYVYDGDSIKAGRFLPTSQKPIRLSTDQSYSEMDSIFISAMTFYKECESFLVNHHNISVSKIAPISPFYRKVE